MEKCPKATGLWEMRLNICVPVGLSLTHSKHAALCELLDVTDGGSRVKKNQEMLKTSARTVRRRGESEVEMRS